MRHLILLFISLISLNFCFPQNTLWKEKLGYTNEDKLLIIHGDDLGVTHSVNNASVDGFENGLMNSSSIMVPCPWYEEIVEYFHLNPNLDYGLHLTLTAEWKHLKWDALTSVHLAPGLHDSLGYLYNSVAEVIANASLEEVENEIRAQINKALDSGLHPSHLDSHMGTLFSKKEFLEILIKLGEEYKIPVFLPEPYVLPQYEDILTPNSILVNTVFMNSEHVEKEKIFEYYDNAIKSIEPGLNEIIVHLGNNNEELKATCIEHELFGAAWRQFDLDYVKSNHLKSLLEENNIKLITWREIQKAIYDK